MSTPATLARAAKEKAAFKARCAAMTGVFAGAGYVRIDPPILQPADVFLDLLGDAIRPSAYVFTDPTGTELCLRPDLTMAACRAFIDQDARAKGPTRSWPVKLWYDGTIFRRPETSSADPGELRHAGVELLGMADHEAADVEVLRLASDGLKAAGVGGPRYKLGDLSLFAALVDAIDLPAQWRGRLRRHFVRPDDFARLLARLAAGAEARQGPRALITALGRLSEDEARAVIADVLDLADIEAVGSRTIEEIAERFLEQAAEASALTLGPKTVGLIEQFLKIEGTPAQAEAALEGFATRAGLDLSAAQARLERRHGLMAEAGIDLKRARFATSFGRRLGYYTGFIFEVEATRGKATLALAAGGRYDGLLRALGSPRDVPAVGATVFCDPLATLGGSS